MKNKPTTHHILARGARGSNVRENKVILGENKHRAFHVLFGIQEVSEQIETILDINNNAIQGDFKRDILKVLELYGNDLYHNGIRKGEQ